MVGQTRMFMALLLVFGLIFSLYIILGAQGDNTSIRNDNNGNIIAANSSWANLTSVTDGIMQDPTDIVVIEIIVWYTLVGYLIFSFLLRRGE